MVLLPPMFHARQRFESSEISDIDQTVANLIGTLSVDSRIRPGQRVAVACSSRGIARYASIVGATIRELKKMGLEPFIIPAMGSHGGGTAEGQRNVLTMAGIDAEKMGVPIISSMETVTIGQTEDGIPVFMDAHAAGADWIVPINRIKAHTMFTGPVESGLMKMLSVGLGKKDGPSIYHKMAFDYGLGHVIETVARTVLARKTVLFGVGIVENAYGRPAKIGILEAERMEVEEQCLLQLAKSLEPRLPLDAIDVLVIDEMGKDISGAGIDCNVIGRIDMPLLAKNPSRPSIKRIAVCDLTKKSAGNAIGVGLADFITRRLFNKIDMEAMNVNGLTAADPEHARIPMVLENDGAVIRAAMSTIGSIPTDKMRIVRIKNTKALETLHVSKSCLDDLQTMPNIVIDPKPIDTILGADGNLIAL